jgi:hypothetical protein
MTDTTSSAYVGAAGSSRSRAASANGEPHGAAVGVRLDQPLHHAAGEQGPTDGHGLLDVSAPV